MEESDRGRLRSGSPGACLLAIILITVKRYNKSFTYTHGLDFPVTEDLKTL